MTAAAHTHPAPPAGRGPHPLSRPGPRLGLMLAAALSAFALGLALFTQYVLGWPPCELCLWQRWPYVATAALAMPLALVPLGPGAARLLAVMAALAIATSGAIGVFHGGVEMGWWGGLSGCGTGLPSPAEASVDDLLATIRANPVVRCTDPTPFLGLTMAWWNAIFAAAGASAVAALALTGRGRRSAR